MQALDVVLIGRNEGDRLVACLASIAGQARRIVYVDSGSGDDSVANARAAGAEVVELAPDLPFTAARARHAGFTHLDTTGGAAPFVQFVDGDCRVQPGWLERGLAAISGDETLGLVTGWRSEIAPEASLYNALCAVEWRRPAGEIAACGGDMMVRSAAYRAVGGFDARVIAAEDDELCCRLRKAGWRLRRIPQEMTLHDAAMRRFGQWWRRAERTGHGFAQVGHLHPGYFRRERARMWLFAAVLPILLILGLWAAWWLAVTVAFLYLLSFVKTARRQQLEEGLPRAEARRHAALLTLSKFPNLVGALRYWLRHARGADMRIIEYK